MHAHWQWLMMSKLSNIHLMQIKIGKNFDNPSNSLQFVDESGFKIYYIFYDHYGFYDLANAVIKLIVLQDISLNTDFDSCHVIDSQQEHKQGGQKNR